MGRNQDYDTFKNWYTHEAPDESEINMIDMAYMAWQKSRSIGLDASAVRFDFDGFGYKYIDSGSGSDWQTRHKDGEILYSMSIGE